MADDERVILENPRRSLTVNFPVRHGRRRGARRSPATASSTRCTMGPTKGGFRYAPERLARRVRGARDVDDVEVRAARPALRRRQGRRALRPAASSQRRRARAHHAPLRRRAHPDHRARRATSRRPTWARASARWRGSWTPTRSRSATPCPEIVTGKPPILGGTEARRQATGLGVVYVHRGACSSACGLPLARPARRGPGLRQRRRRRGARAARASARRSSPSATSRAASYDPDGPRHPGARALDRRARLPRRATPAARPSAGGRPRGALRHPRPGGARAPDHRRERRPRRLPARRRGGQRPDDARGRDDPAPSAASSSCPTSWPTPAA